MKLIRNGIDMKALVQFEHGSYVSSFSDGYTYAFVNMKYLINL